MIQEIILDDQTSIRCGYDECEINDGVAPNTVLYSGVINNYHRESEEFDPICYVVINTAKISQVEPEVKTNFGEVMKMLDTMIESKEYLALEKIKAKINGITLSEDDYKQLQMLKHR